MIDPVTDEWVDVYDASTDPDVRSFTWFGAVTGQTYTFRAFGVNFNARSTQIGNEVSILACGLPRYMDQPLYVNSSRTDITLRWSPPQDDGGCAVSDYAVYRDEDGTGSSAWTVVNPVDRDDPTLEQFSCATFPGGAVLGSYYVFKIVATNRQGSVTSLLSSPMIWAGVPAKPGAAPVSAASITNWERIKLDYTTVTDDGGATVLSYELQQGSPLLNDWQTIVGGDPHTLSLTYTISQNITKGLDYTFRYRAVNQIGGGPWSDMVEVKAAAEPLAPAIPVLLASDSSSI
jgi:titin